MSVENYSVHAVVAVMLVMVDRYYRLMMTVHDLLQHGLLFEQILISQMYDQSEITTPFPLITILIEPFILSFMNTFLNEVFCKEGKATLALQLERPAFILPVRKSYSGGNSTNATSPC